MYTQADLDNIKTAILALATGERVVRVRINDKVTEFGEAQLKDLRDLRAEIQTEVNAASGRSGVVLIQTSKGL